MDFVQVSSEVVLLNKVLNSDIHGKLQNV